MLVLLLLTIANMTGTPPEVAAQQLDPDRICVQRYDSVDSDGDESGLYTVPATAGMAERLPRFDRAVSCPLWTPKRPRVVFTALTRHGDDSELFIADRDGTDVRRLTWNPYWEHGARWSPDARRVAFNRTMGDRTVPQARVVRLRTGISWFVARGWVEDWSPDGRKLLISRDRKLFVVNLRTQATRRLTPKEHRFGFHSASWSNAGGSIAMVGGRVFGSGGEPILETALFTIRRDGTDLTRITRETEGMPFDLDDATWFPDDSRILFSGCWKGCRPYTIEPDGTGRSEVEILNGAEYDHHVGPSWIYR